jgi:hypothetical protein
LAATPAATTPPLVNNDDSSIEDPFYSDEEDEDEEEGAPAAPEDYIPPTPGATVDALGEPVEEDVHTHGEIDIEPDGLHKAKWEKYIHDKAQLLSNGWRITKKSTGQGITLGATVRTRARPYPEGIISGQSEDATGKKWIVSFGDEEPEELKPLQLVCVTQSLEAYVWTLVEDSEPDLHTPAPEEYQDAIGLLDFNFTESFAPASSGSNKAYNYPYLKLLQKMWPGDWKQQLQQLNLKIAADNAKSDRQSVNQVSQREWWVFIGVIISAGPHCKGGVKLWEKPQHRQGNGMTVPINYGPDGLGMMAYYRFREIKAAFPWSFQDKETEETDP